MSNPVPPFPCRRFGILAAGALIALWLALWSGFLVTIVDVAGPRVDPHGRSALQNALASDHRARGRAESGATSVTV